MINKLNEFYLKNRISKIDKDFLEFEENFIVKNDLDLILRLLESNSKIKLLNSHNSIILYLTGLSDEFDFSKARSDTIDGSPPDIDIDFDALDRELAIQWVVDHWGRDNVANIITHGTFKPKSLARGFYRVTEGPSDDLNSLLKRIPQPKFGKEATLEEILDLNEDLYEDHRYENFLSFAHKLENMVSTFGIHAAGVVISDFPIHDIVPLWKNSKADRITQYDKDEVEELGLIKFDFLSIDTLSIVKECVNLVKLNKKQDIDVFNLEDNDKKAYSLMNMGLLTGVFQMETSGNAKKLIQVIKPESIEELSDISALNRPGPMQAGLDSQYITNKKLGYSEKNIPTLLEEILKPTNYTLVYQEQVMDICCKIAGFSLREADDIRRAMGKKKKSVLDKYEPIFISGAANKGIEETEAKELWNDLVGFADYCLSGNTKIYTLERGFVPIKEIVEKKLKLNVLSYSPNGTYKFQQIKQFHDKNLQETLEYNTDNDVQFQCTEDHQFLTSEIKMLKIKQIFQSKKNLKTKE